MNQKTFEVPRFISPEDNPQQVGTVFDTPIVVKGKSWFPLVPIFFLPIMYAAANHRHPDWPRHKKLWAALLSTPLMLGSEWGHNLAHTAAAQRVGHPADAVRIVFGMPLLVYFDINDARVSPREHVIRSLGGPIYNFLVLPFALLSRMLFHTGTVGRFVTTMFAATNAFLAGVGLLPIPGIDGGPILKWSLVDRGQTIPQAEANMRKVDWIVGGGLVGAGITALVKRKYLLGSFLVQLGGLALAMAAKLVKEKD